VKCKFSLPTKGCFKHGAEISANKAINQNAQCPLGSLSIGVNEHCQLAGPGYSWLLPACPFHVGQSNYQVLMPAFNTLSHMGSCMCGSGF